MDTPDVKGLECSTLHCKDVNAILLSQFEEQDDSSDGNNPSVGSADPLTVYLRIRPFSDKEPRNFKNISCIKVLNKNKLITLPPVNSHTHMGIKKGVSDSQTLFSFTKIFDENTGQRDFYDSAILDYIQDFLRGHNVLIFAYGVTNSGKTYTMTGTRANPGVLPRALDSIFQATEHQQPESMLYKPKGFANATRLDKESVDIEIAKKRKYMRKKMLKTRLLFDYSKLSEGSESQVSTLVSTQSSEQEVGENLKDSRINLDPHDCSVLEMDPGETKYSLWVSFVEIHNESIYDLLELSGTHKVGHNKKVGLKFADDQNGNVYIKDVTEIECKTAMEALHLFLLGEQQRRVGETKLNLNSSRSHVIFSLTCIRIDENGCSKRVNTLSLVDLAGSERQVGTKAEGDRLKEAGNINMSLLTLGRCIETMRYNQNRSGAALKIVPFRETKLTRIFQSYLVGRSESGYEGKLTMIVNISQAADTFDETSHALKFSAIAREVIPVTIEIPRPIFHSDKLSDATNCTNILQETLAELNTTVSDLDVEKMNDVQLREYCAALKRDVDFLLDKNINLITEKTQFEIRLRTELSQQYTEDIEAVKAREKERRMRSEQNMNLYHETRMDILQKSIKKDRRLRMRRSRSVDTMDLCEKQDYLHLDKDNTGRLEGDFSKLRCEYENNVKQLAFVQKEKAHLSEELELKHDQLEEVQRSMREMRAEYDNKLLASELYPQEKMNYRKEIAHLEGDLKMTLAQKEELVALVRELKTNASKAQQQLIIENPGEESKELENKLQRFQSLIVENETLTTHIRKLEDETKCMEELENKIVEYATELSETKEKLVIAEKTVLDSQNKQKKLDVVSKSEISKFQRETRSLLSQVSQLKNGIKPLTDKNANLIDQLEKSKATNDKLENALQDKDLKLKVKDKRIKEFESEISQLKDCVLELKDQVSSVEDKLTVVQADQAAREGEATFYQSKITQLDKKCARAKELELESAQLKSDLFEQRNQLREQKLHYEGKMRALESEMNRMKSNLPCSSAGAQQNDITHYNVPRSTRSSLSRPSNHTYISMKDSDPHYESIHSSMLHDISQAITLAPETKEQEIFTSDFALPLNSSKMKIIPATPTGSPTARTTREDSFDSYSSNKRMTAISSEPIYENIPCVNESINFEVVEPSESRENRETHTVNIAPLQKGKRKSLRGETPSPPPKKRNRTSRLLRGNKDKKRNTEINVKRKLQSENLQNVLSPIPETGTPKKGFQFFHSPSIRKLNKNSAPEERPHSITPLTLFSKEKKQSKSKKKLVKKSEISAPLESMESATVPDNPLRRLRPRK